LSFAKNHNLKIIGKNLKIFSTINDHLHHKISMHDHYTQWSRNVKTEKDKKQYHYNIQPELKVKLENKIKEKNKLFQIYNFNIVWYKKRYN